MTMKAKPSYEELERRFQELNTDHTQLENKMLESRFLTEEIMTYMTEGLVLTDTQETVIFINQPLSEMLGYLPEEIIGKCWLDMVSPEQQTIAKEALAKRCRGYIDRYEITLHHKNGEKFPVLIGAGPRFDKQSGEFIGTMGVVTDITERKRAEEALRESEERYRTILNEMAEGYHEVDLAGNFIYFNDAFLNLFGYSGEEMRGTNFSHYAAEESIIKKVYQTYNEIYKTGHPVQRAEWDIIRKDRQRRTLEYSAAVVRDSKNVPNGFRGIVRDITETRQAETEKERLRAQLAQAQKMEAIGTLAGGIAHDFNNMLGVISGRAELGLKKTAPTDPVYKDLEQIHNAAGRSADITRQLLAFARKQTISPRVIDLNSTVSNMIKMLSRLIGEDIDLRWQPAGDLWAVKIDPSQIDQILVNLCVNARDAIADVGKITIETGMKVFDPDYCAVHAGFVPGKFVMLAVSDDGCGMNRHTLDNLFEPFFTTKKTGRGTGLGLATVYGIVKQNNGFINAYSEPGKGSSFRIYLPCHTADLPDTLPEKSVSPIPRGSGETLLVVEDEDDILDMLKAMLKSLNYNILAADSPSRAMTLAQSHNSRIHMVITDVVMPEMSGRDLAGKLSALYPDIKILFMSGYTANVIAHQGVLDEGVHFLQKPFSMDNLAEKLREVLDMLSD